MVSTRREPGDPNYETRSHKASGANELMKTLEKDGKVMEAGKIEQ